ncbi:MAG TPA: glycosyltransferase [Casimicrobiaceae bacterium]|nr:glycosyltransferase [Casimicrobiaceae bacterium]
MSSARASLIVRSVSRPELAEALASAGDQTYDDVEIVVVDATGGRHAPVPDHAGRHPVVFVPGTTRRPRPAAANAGLDAASGSYVGLLDDDDVLDPTHVARLAAALDADPGAVLAFGKVREMRPDGTIVQIGHPRLSRLMLLDACFFPPCAALFRRSVVPRCRFDETLEAAEDWDFWLQVGRCGAFRFVDAQTSTYRADRGRSAMSAGDSRTADPWNVRVRDKWAAERDALVRVVEARFERVLDCLARGDRAGARALADDVLQLYPFHVGALNVRGTLLVQAGDARAALADFETAAEASPDDPASLFNLAQAHEHLGRHAEARSGYRRVLALDPAFAPALARIARLSSSGPPP